MEISPAIGSTTTKCIATIVNNACADIALLLLYQYGSLFLNGSLVIPAQALLTIVAMQFVVVLPIAGLISTRYFSTTGLILPGAIVNGCFVTWLIVAGQATHFAFIG